MYLPVFATLLVILGSEDGWVLDVSALSGQFSATIISGHSGCLDGSYHQPGWPAQLFLLTLLTGRYPLMVMHLVSSENLRSTGPWCQRRTTDFWWTVDKVPHLVEPALGPLRCWFEQTKRVPSQLNGKTFTFHVWHSQMLRRTPIACRLLMVPLFQK